MTHVCLRVFFLVLKILFIFLAPEYFRREITKSLCFSYAARSGCLPMSRRRNSYHATRFSNVATDLLGNEENLIAIIRFTVFFQEINTVHHLIYLANVFVHRCQ